MGLQGDKIKIIIYKIYFGTYVNMQSFRQFTEKNIDLQNFSNPFFHVAVSKGSGIKFLNMINHSVN